MSDWDTPTNVTTETPQTVTGWGDEDEALPTPPSELVGNADSEQAQVTTAADTTEPDAPITIAKENTLLPILKRNCLSCTHLVGTLGKREGDCITESMCPAASGLVIGLGVSLNLVPDYVEALDTGDIAALTELNAKLEAGNEIVTKQFMAKVKESMTAA